MNTKQELKQIMSDHNLTYDKTAKILRNALNSDAPVMQTIQKWAGDESWITSTKCPPWVIYILKRELK